jgi:uncharacterized protein (TIGR00369 family)
VILQKRPAPDGGAPGECHLTGRGSRLRLVLIALRQRGEDNLVRRRRTHDAGARPSRIGPGVAVFAGTPAEYHYNPIGVVHGGFAATLLDSALGCAIHTTLKSGFAYTTVELKVNYVRPLLMSTGPVEAEGKIIHVGARLATAEARVTDSTGKLYAHGSTTCMIFRVAEAQRSK